MQGHIDKTGAIPPPSKSLTSHLLPLTHTPTLLLVSPVYLSSHRISTIDDAGLLAVFLITANTNFNLKNSITFQDVEDTVVSLIVVLLDQRNTLTR